MSANSRDSSATVRDPVRGRARYLVPCTAHCSPRIHGRQLVRRARSRREPRVPCLCAALGRARALRRRVRAGPSPSFGGATRTTPAGARREAARARRHVAVIRRSLAATNARVATLLRRLYVEGDADPVAVILGARSLPAMLAGIDELERATLANRDLAAELGARSRTLQDELAGLARARHELAAAERRAHAAVAAREHRRGGEAVDDRGDPTADERHPSAGWPGSRCGRGPRSAPLRASPGPVDPRRCP